MGERKVTLPEGASEWVVGAVSTAAHQLVGNFFDHGVAADDGAVLNVLHGSLHPLGCLLTEEEGQLQLYKVIVEVRHVSLYSTCTILPMSSTFGK